MRWFVEDFGVPEDEQNRRIMDVVHDFFLCALVLLRKMKRRDFIENSKVALFLTETTNNSITNEGNDHKGSMAHINQCKLYF